MKIAIFGLGYVGSTAAGCMASQGHDVIGFDVVQAKVDAINAGRSPVCEPGLDELIAQAHANRRIRATSKLTDELDDCDVALVCVGTPSAIDGAHNMTYIAQVSRAIARAVDSARETPLTLAYRSTMRPGSCEHVIWPIFESELGSNAAKAVELVYNPEFLREASAIEDFFDPPKIVIGTLSGQPSARMDELHRGLKSPIFKVCLREAEISMFVDNSWHAVKVTFANEIGRVCQKLDISASDVHAIFKSDTKLNISANYTRPGAAFGGSCLPKDVRALEHIAEEVGAASPLIGSLLPSNDAHKRHQFHHAIEGVEPGSKVLLIGLAFKIETDDLRESPAVDMARKLIEGGFDLDIYDPKIEPSNLVGQKLGFACAFLPQINDLLGTRDDAESRDYDLVVGTNHLINHLHVKATKVIDASRIP